MFISYTHGLTCSPTAEEEDILKLNRALAYLKSGHFDAAITDINTTSEATQASEKALRRKALALYNLHRFAECKEVLELLCSKHSSNAAQAELARTNARLVEAQTGVYNFKGLYQEANKLRPPHLDHATYMGPVEVKKCGSKGRALFTTAAVKAGDLLLCEKAFAHAFVEMKESVPSAPIVLLIHAESNTMCMGMQAELIALIVQKLFRNPSLSDKVTDLYHGAYKPVDVSSVDGNSLVDS